MKKNAKQYLIEYAASQDHWLKALIYFAVESNGEISTDNLSQILKNLAENSELKFEKPNIDNSEENTELYFLELKHNQGVNALKENQIIKFCKEVNILYGLNGAGKSSYFKILNEVVGGNQLKKVLPNIYRESESQIDVEIKFNHNNTRSIKWNGSSRSYDPLNGSKVFDTSYLNGLLENRKADSTLIQPLGLNIFSYIINEIDNLKTKLNAQADRKRLEKPVINLKDIQEELSNAFQAHNLETEQKEKIKQLFDFSEEHEITLEKLKQDLRDLTQVNVQDKIKLLSEDLNKLELLLQHLKSSKVQISKYLDDSLYLVKNYYVRLEENKKAKAQYEVLKGIPGNDSQEWKNFVINGKIYSESLRNNEEVCPYCRQTLITDEAKKLIQAYTAYLRDESETKLGGAKRAIEITQKSLEKFPVDFSIDENFKAILIEQNLGDKNLYVYVQNSLKKLKTKKDYILKKLEELDRKTIENIGSDLAEIEIKNLINQIQINIGRLKEENSKKQEKIIEFQNKLDDLNQNKSISDQRIKILRWFEIDKKEKALRHKANQINTRSISELSKKAHDELITESLKRNFSEELKKLGYDHLDIQIENAGTRKGVTSTKLTLIKNNNIKDILSEGEQKAVALALFVSELVIQESKNPIILDDPVTSLDHKIAGKFAERLLMLENQIIIFNHNRLFLDAFETSKLNHICKTIDSDCSNSKGKHIRVFEVKSEGKNSKGVLTGYNTKKAKDHLKMAKFYLKKSPFTHELTTASLIRKTVECTIDEIVFNHQIPTKYSNKNSRIGWGELKKLNNDENLIDTLEAIHGRVSGGEMHNGLENEENPIEVEEFEKMIGEIEGIFENINARA